MELKARYKIGIYLPNKQNGNVLLVNPEYGNPGVGGAQFLMFSLPFYLDKFYPNQYEVVFFAENEKSVACSFPVFEVNNLTQAAILAKSQGCDLFIYRPAYNAENIDFLKEIERIQLKSIAWFHNTPFFLFKYLERNPYIVKCICVSRDQYEFLRDNKIIYKTELVYNALDVTKISSVFGATKAKQVIFMGSITPDKGFHLIARMWPRILTVHPDAELLVIGSGKLYNNSQILGDIGIADSAYEKMFAKYIVDESGNLLPSVKFLGVLGSDKYEIMAKGCVGIPNHPYVRESFCLAAAEFQLCGTPVVTRNYGGVRDSVDNGRSGFLVQDLKGIEDKIISLLSDLELSKEMGKNGHRYVTSHYSWASITPRWNEVITNSIVNVSSDVIVDTIVSSSWKNRFREVLRKMKLTIPILNLFPSSLYFIHTVQFIRLRLERLFY